VEELDSGQIHLWLAYLGEITDPRLLAEYRTLLSEEELEKQQRFHFERDRHRYLVTRAMVRTVLSRYAEVEPREWRFDFNPYGKPSISAEHEGARGIEFNVSHTDGLVVMGIARGRAIGVDVEDVCTRQADIAVADRYFANAEVVALRALRSECQHRRFFEYWTLKESYIKARGMGLSIPLDQFAFELDEQPTIRLTVDARLQDEPERWTFWQLSLGRNHVTAVCVQECKALRSHLTPIRRWPCVAPSE
jgi:4'-phosphopantetheinyl transferase